MVFSTYSLMTCAQSENVIYEKGTCLTWVEASTIIPPAFITNV